MTEMFIPDTGMETAAPAAAVSDSTPAPAPASAEPAEGGFAIPPKFRDPTTGQLRAEALIQSYQELERKLGATGTPRPDVPDDPDGYEIAIADPQFEIDKEVNARLHQAGFSRQQAQLVYDLATERLGPIVSRMATAFETQRQVDRLAERFGGQEKWSEMSQQLSSWGKANLTQDVFHALASSYDGVLALHRMMAEARSEPGLGRVEHRGDDMQTEQQLREMMKDPRYWRDHDPAYVAKVTRGYERLYPSEG
ncbi:MAG: hypothetical protein H7841_04365 [Magnetospirillum sp. WYHS-4]